MRNILLIIVIWAVCMLFFPPHVAISWDHDDIRRVFISFCIAIPLTIVTMLVGALVFILVRTIIKKKEIPDDQINNSAS